MEDGGWEEPCFIGYVCSSPVPRVTRREPSLNPLPDRPILLRENSVRRDTREFLVFPSIFFYHLGDFHGSTPSLGPRYPYASCRTDRESQLRLLRNVGIPLSVEVSLRVFRPDP